MGILVAAILTTTSNVTQPVTFCDTARVVWSAPRIADADPSRRTEYCFKLPTRLVAHVAETAFQFTFDPESFENVYVDVGHNMVVACSWSINYHTVADSVWLRKSMGVCMGRLAETVIVIMKNRWCKGLDTAERPTGISVDLILFETDLPPQHLWIPETADYYRVLWEGSVKGQLTAD